MSLSRRTFLKQLSAGSVALGAGVRAASARAAAPRVVVIGAGYGGATAARYIRTWSPDIAVTLVERDAQFVSCPLSNRVLAGVIGLGDLTRSYASLTDKAGVQVVRDEAVEIDPSAQRVRLASGTQLPYDRLILSPGLDLVYDQIPGLQDLAARRDVLHAWKAGEETLALRRQLEAMPDGGLFAMVIPKAPYRCPPGPYERACQVAWYFKRAKPKSKILLLDANEKVQSKEGLFTQAWKELYPGIVEYRPNSQLLDVDAATRTAKLEFEDVTADVLNVIPPQRAAQVAARAGLITANDKWCGVDFLTFESLVHKNIHVLGDAILAAPAMPKSGHMANQHAKVCAAAVIALLHGEAVNPAPMLTNTCYSFISDKEAVHIASVHKYDAAQKTMMTVPGSGGLSRAPNALEGTYGEAWGRNIWADMLG